MRVFKFVIPCLNTQKTGICINNHLTELDTMKVKVEGRIIIGHGLDKIRQRELSLPFVHLIITKINFFPNKHSNQEREQT